MTTKAYLIGSHFLCGLDQNDVAMPLLLKSKYEKTNVMYVSSSITNFMDGYFASATCKESVIKKNMRKVETIAETVTRNDKWPALCFVDIGELEELRQELIHRLNRKSEEFHKRPLKEEEKRTAVLVDLDNFDSNFEDDDIYYERFPHVLTTNVKPASYVGILNALVEEEPNHNDQASPAFRSNDRRMDDIEVTNAIPFDDNAVENFVVVARPDELQLVPYVAPVPDELQLVPYVAPVEEEEEEEEIDPAYNCVIS